jgi:hypothetical protein
MDLQNRPILDPQHFQKIDSTIILIASMDLLHRGLWDPVISVYELGIWRYHGQWWTLRLRRYSSCFAFHFNFISWITFLLLISSLTFMQTLYRLSSSKCQRQKRASNLISVHSFIFLRCNCSYLFYLHWKAGNVDLTNGMEITLFTWYNLTISRSKIKYGITTITRKKIVKRGLNRKKLYFRKRSIEEEKRGNESK